MRKPILIKHFVVLFAVTFSQSVWSISLVDIDAARINGLAFLFQSQKGDGSWSSYDSMKVQTTATALEALVNAGIKSGETYGAAVAWLSNAETASIDSTARKIAALASTGMNVKSRAQELLVYRPKTDRQVWGGYPQYEMSFPDTPLGIAAMRLSGYAYSNATDDLKRALACEILPAQRPESSGKGWSYTKKVSTEVYLSNSGSALLPTAITLLEIAATNASYGWTSVSYTGTGCSTFSLITALNDGVSFLLTKQNADNGFGENGVSTPLQTAIAYLAIQAVNTSHPALDLAQGYLLEGAGRPRPNGAWQDDPLTTAMVLKTFPTLNTNTLVDGDRDGVPDEIEVAINNGTSPISADGRNTGASGNGLSVPGVNTAVVVASVRYLHPMSPLQLSPAGADGYILTNGYLPPGISMDASGLLNGIPTQIGSYSFSYAAGGTAPTLAQIVVTPPNGDLNDDGRIDVADVALLERIELGLASATALQLVSADVSPLGAPNGAIDLADLQRLKRMALGLE